MDNRVDNFKIQLTVVIDAEKGREFSEILNQRPKTIFVCPVGSLETVRKVTYWIFEILETFLDTVSLVFALKADGTKNKATAFGGCRGPPGCSR